MRRLLLLFLFAASSCKKKGVVEELITVENRRCVRSYECREAEGSETASVCDLEKRPPRGVIECPEARIMRSGPKCSFVVAPAIITKELRVEPVFAEIDCPPVPGK